MPVDNRLCDLLLRWEELYRQDQGVTPEELCRDCPELLESLKERIDQLRAMDALLTLDESDTPFVTTLPPEPMVSDTTSESQPPSTTTIAGYQILGELGQGGMGVVYKARQLALDRLVAVKMILAGREGGMALARFQREAEAVARLQHPNLVQIFDVGKSAGRSYFTMEFLDGGTLEKKIDRHPQLPRRAAEIVEILARAMHAVHLQGIVHRDLKPSNVLFTSSGVPKVSDFGLVKRFDETSALTATDYILGTPSYMAPEQAESKLGQIGPATDIYALGGILYEMLTGRPPFEAATPLDTVLQVTSDDPVPPHRLQPKVPLDLETICLKCLEKKPSKRYTNAEALADDLRRFLAGEPILARPIGVWERARKWAARHPAAAALLGVSSLAILVIMVGALIYQMHLSQALRDAVASATESRQRLAQLHVVQGARELDKGDWFAGLAWFTEALRLDEGDAYLHEIQRIRIASTLRQSPRLVHLCLHQGPVRYAEFSPDGRLLVTTSTEKTARVWDLAAGEPACPPLEHDGPVLHASFSPDGRLVVTASEDGTARCWDLSAGRQIAVLAEHQGPVRWACFNSDGKYVLTASDDGSACVWDSATGKRVAAPMRHKGRVCMAAFSGDSQKVVTASADHSARVWNASSGEPITGLLKHSGTVSYAMFRPDGQRVITASTDGTARIWDTVTGKPLANPLRHRGAVVQASFSADGHRVVTASADHTACIWDAETGQLMLSVQHYGEVTSAAFSPDGRWIVTSSEDNTTCLWDSTDGEQLQPYLGSNGRANWAAFSPNGKWVAVASNEHVARVWDVALTLEGRGTKVEKENAHRSPGPWLSTDGRLMIEAQEGGVQLSAIAPEPGRPKPVGKALACTSHVLYAAFSPDNGQVATASDDNTVRIWDTLTGELLIALMHDSSAYFLSFSSTGRYVFTATKRSVRVWEARTGEPITPPASFAGQISHVSFAADDSEVASTSTDGRTWTWSLRGDNRPTADLIGLARLLAGKQVDPSRGLLPIGPEALNQSAQSLRRKYPQDLGALQK
jgi:WD40 repeat protein